MRPPHTLRLLTLTALCYACTDHYLAEEDRLPDLSAPPDVPDTGGIPDGGWLDVPDGGLLDVPDNGPLLDAGADATPDAITDPLDRDGDGVPDRADFWPDDPAWPGRALPQHLYAHTYNTLYFAPTADPTRLSAVGPMKMALEDDVWAWLPNSAFDVALDPFGVLYIVTAGLELMACQPDTARCRVVSLLSSRGCGGGAGAPPNALGWAATPDYPDGVLVAAGGGGGCYIIPAHQDGALIGFREEQRLTFPRGYTSSGDIAQDERGDLYITATGNYPTDSMLRLTPTTQAQGWMEPAWVVALEGAQNLWGLAAMGGGRWIGWAEDGRLLEVWVLGDDQEVVSLGGVLRGDAFTGAANPPLLSAWPP